MAVCPPNVFLSEGTTQPSARKLKHNKIWDIRDHLDANAAAAAIRTKQPIRLEFIFDDDDCTLNGSLISKVLDSATKKTKVWLLCLSAFYKGEKKEESQELYQLCATHEMADFNAFFGHPGVETFSAMPHIFCWVGLPVMCQADYQAVLELHKTRRINSFCMSLSCNIPPSQISPMRCPVNVDYLRLHFYKLETKDLEKVKALIDAIIPEQFYFGLIAALYFVKCRFSFADCRRLAQLLKGFEVWEVFLLLENDLAGDNKEIVEKEMKEAMNSQAVHWHCEWLYGSRPKPYY